MLGDGRTGQEPPEEPVGTLLQVRLDTSLRGAAPRAVRVSPLWEGLGLASEVQVLVTLCPSASHLISSGSLISRIACNGTYFAELLGELLIHIKHSVHLPRCCKPWLSVSSCSHAARAGIRGCVHWTPALSSLHCSQAPKFIALLTKISFL